MSDPWWIRNAAPAERKLVTGPFGRRPSIGPGSPSAVAKEVRARREGFVPEWSEPLGGDAGSALVSLFADLVGQVGQRLARLPDKALVEFYQAAGVRPSRTNPATALVRFTLSPAAPGSVPIGKGFQVGAKPATGQGPIVVFETQDNLAAAPVEVDSAFVLQGAIPRPTALKQGRPDRPFPAIGDEPSPGNALLIGLKGTAAPTAPITLSLALAPDDGVAAPVAAGGIESPSDPPPALVAWECLTRGQFQPADVLRDETRGLAQSGLVELSVPPAWGPEVAVAGRDAKPLWWVRVRLLQGRFVRVPRIESIDVNVARVRAVQTIRDEVPEAIADSKPPQMALARTPVVPGSLVLEVTEPLGAGAGPGGARVWTEVPDLAPYGPTDPVYTLEPDRGLLTFGEGAHGAPIPPGFRNVVARSYEVARGRAGAVGSGTITTLLQSAPFLSGVTNPAAATGGVDAEASLDVLREGPEKVRTRDRAVTVADYALLSRSVEGAEVRRALALSGTHPGFPGGSIPGVVNVIVVPPARGAGPPLPDGPTLDAVARGLGAHGSPAGVEVVASAPSYRTLDADVGFVADPSASVGDVVRALIATLATYLDPLIGGEDGRGWPFGQPLIYAALLLRLINADRVVRAIPTLRLTVDGAPQPPCSDVPLGVGELFWPRTLNVFPVDPEVGR